MKAVKAWAVVGKTEWKNQTVAAVRQGPALDAAFQLLLFRRKSEAVANCRSYHEPMAVEIRPIRKRKKEK